MRIVRKTVTEQVAEFVLDEIRKGDYRPGERLPSQDELARQLEVSRVSVREALVQLQSMGVIDIRQGDGTFVNDGFSNNLMTSAMRSSVASGTSKDNLVHLLEVRRIIEQHTVELAAMRAEDDKILPLQDILDEMERSTDPEHFLEEDLEFHLQIARASGNPLLFRLLDIIRHTFWDDLLAVLEIPGLMEQAIQYHRRIYEALKSKDKEAAVRLLLEHLDEPERRLLARGERSRSG